MNRLPKAILITTVTIIAIVGLLKVATFTGVLVSGSNPKWLPVSAVLTGAICSPEIKHVRVVHYYPISLDRKFKKLEEMDPEFLSRANAILSGFWKGDASREIADGDLSYMPTGEHEMSLVFYQRNEGDWQMFVKLYDAKLLSALSKHSLENTRSPNHILQEGSSNTEKVKSIVPRYQNPLHRSIGYTGNTDVFNYYAKVHEPKLFQRSLADLVNGRCDRAMSYAIIEGDAPRDGYVGLGEFR